MVGDALGRTGKSGVSEYYESVPAYSGVGALPSNGRAERAVQMIEDQLRILKSAIESRTDSTNPSDHQFMRWLVEHSASLLDRVKGHGDGNTACQALHGKRCSDNVAEFEEQVFFSVPKKLRSKLCICWRMGTYLGIVTSTNEHCIGICNGNVI